MAFRILTAAAAAGFALTFTAGSPAFAHGHSHDGHHGGAHHHGGQHGGGHHGGWHPHGGHPHHAGGSSHGHGGWRGRTVVINRPYPVWGGSRTVVVDRPYPVYGHQYPIYRAAVPASYGPGCHISRSVGITPWGWHKIVTTKTCLVP